MLTMFTFHLKLETAKKTYHMACKEEKIASTREANSKGEASVTSDQQKKLQEKVDKCKNDVQKVSQENDAYYVQFALFKNVMFMPCTYNESQWNNCNIPLNCVHGVYIIVIVFVF